MSYTTLYVLKGQMVHEVATYKNSHGGAIFIWNCLWNKYCGQGYIPLHNDEKMKELWGLHKNPDLLEFERIAMRCTFDRVLVKKENWGRIADVLYQFEDFYHRGMMKDYVCSLAEQAKDIRALIEEDPEDAVAICWDQTSLSGSLWDLVDKEGASLPIVLEGDDRYFYVFDEVEEETPC